MFLGGATPDKFNSLQTWLIYAINWFTGKCVLWSISVMWTFKSRPKVCYKKYLGPDWKPDYGLSGSLIGNHQSWADMLVSMQYQPCAFVAKDCRNIPLVGTFAVLCGCLLFDRGNKDQRQALFEKIEERQKLCEKGAISPLYIFPEGGTTNGSAMIKWAKGAF